MAAEGSAQAIDVKWACKLAQKLQATALSHLHFVVARLACGALGAILLLFAHPTLNILSTLWLVLFWFLDHAQKEFGILQDRPAEFETALNRFGGMAVWPLAFLCLGIGQLLSFGLVTLLLGFIASACAALIQILLYALHEDIKKKENTDRQILPRLRNYDLADLFYLMPLVALLNILDLFLLFSTIVLLLFLSLLLVYAYKRRVWF